MILFMTVVAVILAGAVTLFAILRGAVADWTLYPNERFRVVARAFVLLGAWWVLGLTAYVVFGLISLSMEGWGSSGYDVHGLTALTMGVVYGVGCLVLVQRKRYFSRSEWDAVTKRLDR